MAKKPKKPEAEAGEDGAAPAPAKGRKKLFLFGGIGAALLAAAGGGYFLLAKPKDKAAEEAAKPPKPVAFVEMREMTVNLADEAKGGAPRFLKFKVALEVKEQKLVADVQPLLPRVEDAFQVFVRELRPADVEGSAAFHRLREELLRRVNVAVHPAKVDAVLFKDMVIQ